MESLCTQCGEHLAAPFLFCARCGARVPLAAPAAEHPEHEAAPVTGAFSGLGMGLIAAPVLLIFGIMICLTGWGIVIGLPLIVCGLLAPLAGPVMGMTKSSGQ